VSNEAPQQAAAKTEPSRIGAAAERFINLAEGEGARALRLLSLIFVVSTALVFLKAAQGGIFLAAYPRKMIPWAFAASAVSITPFSALAVASAPRIGPVRLAAITLLGCAVGSLALRGLLFASVPGTPFVVYVVIEVISGLVLIQTWSVVSGAVNPRSAKRILPIAGVGASIAWTLGGLLVSRLVAVIGATGLLVVAPALFGLSLWLIQTVAREDLSDAVQRAPKASMIEGFRSGLEFVTKVPLMRLCLVLSVIALLSEQLMDFQLLSAARERYGDQAAIAGFFGRFYGITSAVSLAIQLGLSSRILARLGAPQALSIPPLATVFFALGALIVPGFAPILLLRANDRVLKGALWSSAMEQAQTPLPVVQRAQARALSRGVIAPLAYAIAALGLAALPEEADPRVLSLLTLLAVLGMVAIMATGLRRAYVTALRQAIDDRRLRLDGELTATTIDREAAETIARDLEAEDEGKALLAAELLVYADPAVAERLLRLGLSHAAPAVRVAVLDGLGRVKTANTNEVAALLARDPSPEVRLAAVRRLAASRSRDEAVRHALEARVNDPDGRVRAACRVACVTLDDPDGVRRGTSLVPLLTGDDPDLIAAALDALGPRAGKTSEVLAALRRRLVEGEQKLRLLTLEAIVRIGARAMLTEVGPLLEDPRTTEDAVTQLLRWGDDALQKATQGMGFPTASLASSTLAPDSMPLSVVSLRGSVQRPLPLEGVARLLGHADAGVSDHARSAIARRVQAGRTKPLLQTSVQPVLEREVAVSFSYLSLLAGIARDDGTPDWEVAPEYRFLAGEIDLRFRAVRKRVLDLLSLVHGKKLTSVVEAGLRRAKSSPKVEMDAQIAELLEMALPLPLARRIVPLFDKLSLRERLREAERVDLLDRAAMRDPLEFLVGLGDAHLRVCAMITYGSRAEARYPEAYKEDEAVIPVFERMRFLRSVPLFAEIPGEDLRMVAAILDTVEHAEGSVVFRKGDLGEDMYVIVRGRVAIRDGDADIATLGEREFFGELSVIDREARSADAVALAPTELLRLRATDLGELMARRPQIREQILLVLVRRLRALNARVAQ